jgi:hypothetical protein
MKICPSCQRTLADNASSCPGCGRQFTSKIGLIFFFLMLSIIGMYVLLQVGARIIDGP